MDITLLKTIIISSVALILGFPLLRMIASGKIAGLTASKDGIKLDMTAINTRTENKYYLDKRINEIDEHTQLETYRVTHKMTKKLTRIFIDKTYCSSTMIALVNELKNPLYESLRENNFKEKLTLKNKSMFIANKINELQEAFDDFSAAIASEPCAIDKKLSLLPQWEDIKLDLISCLSEWSDNISIIIQEASASKIETYKEYKTVFQKSKDEKFMQILDECIAKNEGYIRALRGE